MALKGRAFLSTLSLRRATVLKLQCILGRRYFYPRSPCGERPVNNAKIDELNNFYPRSPCGERQSSFGSYIRSIRFLSTLSLRRATGALDGASEITLHFYPRSPCGERRVYMCPIICTITHFYPRSPCGERPWARGSRVTYVEISIHALLAESD